MKTKRFFSVLIALSLALTLTAPVRAAEEEMPTEEQETVEFVPEDTTQTSDEAETPDDTQSPGETVIPDDTQNPDETEPTDDTQDLDETEPTDDTQNPDDTNLDVEVDHIDVAVPALGQVILNPYRMPVDTSGGTTNEQVIYQPQELVNYSDFPVIVTAVVTGSLAGDAWFVNAPPAQDGLDKEMFLYAEFQNQPDLWAEGYSDAPHQLLVNDIAKDVITLESGGRGYFRLSGAMTPFPQNMWGEENALSVTISYTFARDPASIDVVEPMVPVDPEEPPGTPPPLDLMEPVDPVEPVEPIDPVEPVEPSDPFEPTDTTEPSDMVEPEEPADTTEPSDTVEPVEPVDPIEPADTEEPPGTPPPLEPYEDLEQSGIGLEDL